MNRAYHDTTDAGAADLDAYEAKARKQNARVLNLFRSWSPRTLSPSQVHALLGGEEFGPLTSVRRAVTTLTDGGSLEKTDQQVEGAYGRREHTWKFKPHQARLL